MPTQTVEGPFGARMLSDADWNTQMGKMFTLCLRREEEPYKSWNKLHFDLVAKFCLNRCSDWFYHSDNNYVFGSEEDFYLVKLWAKNNNMIHKMGEHSLDA